MKEAEMEKIADLITLIINEVASNEQLPEDKEQRAAALKKFRQELKSNNVVDGVRSQVVEICGRFPLYPELKV